MKETTQMTLQLNRKVHDSNTCPTLKHKNTLKNKNTNIQKHESYAIGKTLVTFLQLCVSVNETCTLLRKLLSK